MRDNDDIWRGCLRVDPDKYFADPATTLGPTAESMIVLANPVQPHSEGEIRSWPARTRSRSRHPDELLRRPS